MKILVDTLTAPGKAFDTESVDPRAEGGEGIIYQLPEDCLAAPSGALPLVKIYLENVSNMTVRQGKGIMLADKYSLFATRDNFAEGTPYSADQFAFPQKNAVNADSQEYAGFSMRDLGSYPPLEDFVYEDGKVIDEATGTELTEEEAVDLFMNITYGVSILHRNKIVLGDLNDRNILYDFDRKMPLFVDIDSAQVDEYACDAASPLFLDPLVTTRRLDGSADQTNGAYEYSETSDIFAIAVIAYKLLTGYHPAFIRAKGSKGEEANTRSKLFFMRLLKDPSLAQSEGLELLDNSAHQARLEELKAKFPDIYAYFEDVFVNGRRERVTARLPRDDYRHPDYADFIGQEFNEDEEDTEDDSTGFTAPAFDEGRKIGKFSLGKWLGAAEGVRAEVKLRYSGTTTDSPAFRNFVGSIGYDYADLLAGGLA